MNPPTSNGQFSLSLSTTNNMGTDSMVLAQKASTSLNRFAAHGRPTCQEKSASIKFSANKFVTQRYDCFNSHYEIIELLGEGAYGEVYVCRHKESGAERAVKILQVEDEEDAEIVLSEFNILRGIDHPNLLKIYQLYEDEDSGKFYIVSDLYQGGELYDELEALGYFDEADVAVLINQLLGCINYCHNNGIAHRDLKPENILLADASMKMDDIKIIDFGLAEVFNNLEDARFTDKVGSSYYIAPQILDGDYGPKCDVWSIGVIAFILLSGEAPFDGEDDQEIVDAVYEGKFTFDENEIWEDISEEAKDFVEWLLTYDEDERPTAEEALQHPWLENTRRLSCQGLQERRCQKSREYLSNLEYFTADSKLKQAVCAFIASQLIMKHEKDVIDELFRAMDTSCDGKLSREELKAGFANFLGRTLSDEEVDDIFENVNYSCSGAIEYSEFIIASITLDESRLQATFNEFDRSNKGVLTANDLKHALELGDGPEVDKYVDKILRQIDTGDTGYISFEEFEAAMTPAPFVTRRLSRRQSERALGRRHRSRSRNIRRTSHIVLDDKDPARCNERTPPKESTPQKLKSSNMRGILKSWRAAAKRGPRKIHTTKSFSGQHASAYARKPSRVLSRASIRSTHEK